jgi:hypothetical protein
VWLNFEADLVLISLHEGENGEDRIVCGTRYGNGELVALVIKEVNESGEREWLAAGEHRLNLELLLGHTKVVTIWEVNLDGQLADLIGDLWPQL